LVDKANILNVPHTVTHFNALADFSPLHIVSLASFDDDHAAQVLASLQAGQHVFVEKPLCRTQNELESIHKQWQTSPRALLSNCVLRKAPLYEWLKEVIQGGELGDIYAFDGEYLYGRLHKIVEGWRKEIPDYSVMAGGGVHLLDLMLGLLGERPTTVTCVGNKIVTQNTLFQYDDFATALYTFPSGLVGRISAHFGCVHRHHHVVRVFGSKGTFIYDDQGPRVHKSRAEDSMAVVIDKNPLPAHKGVLIPSFLDSIQHNTFHQAARQEFDLVSVLAATDRARQVKETLKIQYLAGV
jgi:predicted dehydrogenase